MHECDWCGGPPADHDKPYRFECAWDLHLRLGRAEIKRLQRIRESVLEVQHGYLWGPAWGDIAPDGGEWKESAA